MNRETGVEQGILDRAIQAVERETGLCVHADQRETLVGGQRVDAIIRLDPGDHVLTVEIKKWAQHANLGALINQIKQLPEEGLLVADYVNPKMADKLRQQQVQFIDTAGNAFINLPVWSKNSSVLRYQHLNICCQRHNAFVSCLK